MSAAADRVEASRARLLLAMKPPARDRSEPMSSGSPAWLAKLREFPVVAGVLDSLASWWASHPMRPAARLAGEASGAALRPVAALHPYALVLAAALAGAALAWARPWRWAFRSALLAGLLPQLASRVVSSLPLESWFSLVGGSRTAAASPSRPSPTP